MKLRKPARQFILDNSIVMAWYFDDETVQYADDVHESLSESTAVVPSLWHLEVANALLVGERRKRTTETNVTQFINVLAEFPIVTDELTHAKACADTLVLARAHDLSAYDAAYLELARRRDLPLATLDKRLRKAARVAGISLYIP